MTLNNPRFLLFIAAIVCAVIALIVALGASLVSSTWTEWITGSFLAYYLSKWPKE